MNTHNTLIWLFLYIHICLNNLVESTDTDAISSHSSESSSVSTGSPSYGSTDDLEFCTVDSSGLGIGWNTFMFSTDLSHSGSSQLATHGSYLRVSESGSFSVSTTEPKVSSQDSNGESSSSNDPISDQSGTSSSNPSQGSNNLSVYNYPNLGKMIKDLTPFQFIDFIDLLANQLQTLKSDFNLEKNLIDFLGSTHLNIIPIVINISELRSTCEYELAHSDDKVIYTPEEGYGFKLVMQNSTVLWHTNDLDEDTKIECDHKNHTVTILKPDGTSEVVNFKPDPQDTTGSTSSDCEQTPTIKHTTVLNINKITNLKAYKWSFSNGIVTCTTIEKFGFRLVRQNKNVLWHTINRKNCSNKVECDYNENKVTIYLLDGTTIVTKFVPEPDACTLITIDIHKAESTDEYTYNRNGKYGIFIPNSPYRVKRVVNNGLILWWYRDNMHPHTIKVSDTEDGKRRLVLYFKSDTIEFIDPLDISNQQSKKGESRTRSESDEDSYSSTDDEDVPHFDEEGTSDSSDQSGSSNDSKVKLFKANPSDPVSHLELDANEYSMNQKKTVTSFKIADSVNCVKLMFDNVILWEHDPNQHGGKHPKSVDFYPVTETLILNFEELYIIYEMENGSWGFKITDTSGVKLFIVDPNDNTKIIELDSTQLQITKDGYNYIYEIANGVNCSLLKFNGVPVWKHDPNQHGGKHPKSVEFYPVTETLILNFDEFYIICEEEDGNWIFIIKDTSGVKLYVADPNDNTKIVELDSTQLTIIKDPYKHIYQIPYGVNCSLLKYNGVSLWMHDPCRYDAIYPKSLVHDIITDTLILRFEGLDMTFTCTSDGWIFNATGPSAVQFHIVDPNDNTKTVELDSTKLTSTTNGDITTFTIADGVECIKLMYGPNFLWQHDPNERGGKHPKSLDFTKTTEQLVLRFAGLDMTFAKNVDGNWVFTQSGPLAIGFYAVDPIDHNNIIKIASTQLTVTQIGRITTFTIDEGVNCIALTYGLLILWRHDANKYGGKHPKSLDYTNTTETLVLKFDGLDLRFGKNDQGLWDIYETDTSGSGACTSPGSDVTSTDGTSDASQHAESETDPDIQQVSSSILDRNKSEDASAKYATLVEKYKHISTPESHYKYTRFSDLVQPELGSINDMAFMDLITLALLKSFMAIGTTLLILLLSSEKIIWHPLLVYQLFMLFFDIYLRLSDELFLTTKLPFFKYYVTFEILQLFNDFKSYFMHSSILFPDNSRTPTSIGSNLLINNLELLNKLDSLLNKLKRMLGPYGEEVDADDERVVPDEHVVEVNKTIKRKYNENYFLEWSKESKLKYKMLAHHGDKLTCEAGSNVFSFLFTSGIILLNFMK